MDLEPQFQSYMNSALDVSLGLGQRLDIEQPRDPILNTLVSISALYLYSNPPPMGYGTPAPKVAESVLRAYSFNNNEEEDQYLEIDGYRIMNPVWMGKGQFNWFQPSCNFDAPVVHESAIEFFDANQDHIIKTVNDIMIACMSRNADVLTKGRQTYCPLTESSLPCPRAYANMMDFFKRNGAPTNLTILQLIGEFNKLLTRNSIKASIVEDYQVLKKVRTQQGMIQVARNKKRIVWKTLTGDEAYHYTLGLARSFCTYIKHGERSHLERRAIASPNIIKRAYLYIIEEVHLALGKLIEGSTISIGGEEKKAKIIKTVESLDVEGVNNVRKQGTEDATKWNETLSAALFAMVQKTFLDNEVRSLLPRSTAMTKFEELYLQVSMTSHFLLSIKRVTLGPGLQGKSDGFHGEISFNRENLHKFNARTRAWVEKILVLREGRNYILASPGMLMGMHNALSTTVGLVPCNFLHVTNSEMKVLRSSDDSMSMHSGRTEEEVMKSVDLQYMEFKLSAIALSPKKTMVFKERFGEFTSWFQDGTLISQFGPETTTLRPGGKNPHDDFYQAAKSTQISLLNCQSNVVGAEIKLTLAINNVRNLYRITQRGRVEGERSEMRVLADGGYCSWDIANCHLDETVLKESRTGPETAWYYQKIRNPDNPFSRPAEEQTYYDRDSGMLVQDYLDIPATIFSYVKRGNRASLNRYEGSNAESERDARRALEIIHECDYSTAIRTPSEATESSDYCLTGLLHLAQGIDLDPAELRLYEAAKEALKTGQVPDQRFFEEDEEAPINDENFNFDQE